MIPGPDRQKPYIVSSDTSFLMQRWARKHGFQIPNGDYFVGAKRDLGSVLSGYFPGGVIIVQEDVIRDGINRLTRESQLQAISLDRAYVTEDTANLVGFIDATRIVNEQFEDIGLLPRPGAVALDKQIERFQTTEESPVVLIDDVIFTGGGVKNLAESLSRVNRPVRQIIGGIGISKGIDALTDAGYNVNCVLKYEEVVDETCERDFTACVPMSGRTVQGIDGSVWSAPYFKPFGHPEKWASIPLEKVDDFSAFCLEQSKDLWKKVEEVSGMAVPVMLLSRRLKNMPIDLSVVEAFRRLELISES